MTAEPKIAEPKTAQPEAAAGSADEGVVDARVTRAGRAGPGRPRDPHLDRAILAAALRILGEGGAEALTIDAVASLAGVSRATVYRRYENRVDLMEAAFVAAAAPTHEAPGTGSVRADLIAMVERLSRALVESDGGRLLPVMLAAARGSTEVREALERFTSSRRAPTIESILAGVERGELRDDIDPDLVTDMIVGVVIHRLLMRNRPMDPDDVERLVDQVLRGLLI